MTAPAARILTRLAAAGAIAALVSAFWGAHALRAEDPQGAGAKTAVRTLTVSGEGEASARPDIARLSAGVVSEAKTAAAALEANTAAMNRVFAAIRAQGVKEEDMQTSDFSVQPQYPPYRPDQPEERRIIGYQVSNQVTVTVRDLKRLGAALDALVQSGANQVHGVSFAIDDPEPLAAKARDAAVKHAEAKARAIAAAAGVRIVRVMTIQEAGGGAPVPMYMAMRAEKASDVPVAAGQQTVSASVSITYEIE